MSAGGGSKSSIQVFANIFIAFIGAGVLGLPYAFKEAGILEGTFIMLLVGFLSVKSMLLLIDCKYELKGTTKSHKLNEFHSSLIHDSSNDVTFSQRKRKFDSGRLRELMDKEIEYSDLGLYSMGRKGKLLVEICIIVSQLGFCCAYLIFIQENINHYFPFARQSTWLMIMMFLLTLLSFIRKLSNLAIFSLMADFANVFAYAVVFYFDFSHLNKIRVHPKAMKFNGIPFFLVISLYCFEGAGLILSLEASADHSIRHLFKRIFKMALTAVTVIYISFGVAGYLSFGPHTHSIITLNLPRSTFPHLVKGCLCFSLFFTYPIMLFPVVQLLESKLFYDSAQQAVQGAFLRGGLVATTGMVVVAIPNFSVLMALVGATCCTLLAFILPAFFHLYIFQGKLSFCQRALDYLLIFIGIIGAILGTWDGMTRMFPGLSVRTLLSTIFTFVR